MPGPLGFEVGQARDPSDGVTLTFDGIKAPGDIMKITDLVVRGGFTVIEPEGSMNEAVKKAQLILSGEEGLTLAAKVHLLGTRVLGGIRDAASSLYDDLGKV